MEQRHHKRVYLMVSKIHYTRTEAATTILKQDGKIQVKL